MNWKQHKLLSISTVLFVIFMLAGGGLLFKTRSGYVNQKQELKGKLGELDKLNKRMPFPNQDNLNVMEENLERVQTFYQTMMRTMADGQVKPREIEPARFPALLNGSLHRLRQRAKKEKIHLLDGFSFGFKNYADGSLPKPDHVARLTSQVQMVESLVETIITAGAESILEVEREQFEAEIPKTEPRTRRRASSSAKKTPVPAKESELHTSEEITVVFTGTDQAVWAALNALAAHDQFVVITEMELENPVKPNVLAAPVYRKADGGPTGRRSTMSMYEDPMAMFMPPGVSGEFPPGVRGGFPAGVRGSAADESAALPEEAEVGPPVSHEKRIVAGREAVLARITVKIFQINTEELTVEEEPVQEGSSS